MAKRPEVGRTKTRLSPPLTLYEAAALYEAMLRDTIGLVGALAGARLAIAVTPPEAADDIARINRENPLRDTYLVDVPGLPADLIGTSVRDMIAENARHILQYDYFITGDIPLERTERERIVALMDTAAVRDLIPVRFGMILRRVTGRRWPTDILLMRDPGDAEFDHGVTAAVDMATPVALLHASRDSRWCYVQTPDFTCWVPSDGVAFGAVETVRELNDTSGAYILAVGHRVPVYADPSGAVASGSIQMGTTLPVRTAGREFIEVRTPARGQHNELVAGRGYVRRNSDISMGFLPYTPRNVYTQLFRLYGRRFGWGGMYGERDCSRFVQDVFACFGIRLPRNSGSILRAAPAVLAVGEYGPEGRSSLIRDLPGGISLLGWQGHVMVYLGSVDGTPYVIHDTWARRVLDDDGIETVHRIARVVVSGLDLNAGSRNGSLADRVDRVAIIGDYIFGAP